MELAINFKDLDVFVEVTEYINDEGKSFGLPEDCYPPEQHLEFELTDENSEFVINAFEASPHWYDTMYQLVWDAVVTEVM